MSIQSFIQAAQLLYENNYFDEGLCLVCCAIDASAAQNHPQLSVGDRYKQFISRHFRTISKFGFPGIEASKIRIKLNCQIEGLKPDKDGYVDITQIIYHTIRCGLVHSCTVDNSIIFSCSTRRSFPTVRFVTFPKACVARWSFRPCRKRSQERGRSC